MKTNSIRNIARAPIVAAVLSLMSGCTIAPNRSLESVTSQQNQVSAREALHRWLC